MQMMQGWQVLGSREQEFDELSLRQLQISSRQIKLLSKHLLCSAVLARLSSALSSFVIMLQMLKLAEMFQRI